MSTVDERVFSLLTRARMAVANAVGDRLSTATLTVGRELLKDLARWDPASGEPWEGRPDRKRMEEWEAMTKRVVTRMSDAATKLDRASFRQRLLRAAKAWRRRFPDRWARGVSFVWKPGLAPSGEFRFLMEGPFVQSMMKEWTEHAASLISNLPNDLYVGAAKRTEVVKEPPEDLAAAIAKRAGAAFTGHIGPETLRRFVLETVGDEIRGQQGRARRIAVDQTRKAAATLTMARCMDNGVEEYIWRCTNDAHVAGKPGGLYPEADPRSKVHGDHWSRNGKKFRWDSPPPDGWPGFPLNCRCHAEPVITSFA